MSAALPAQTGTFAGAVQAPTKYQPIIKLKTAKVLGLELRR